MISNNDLFDFCVTTDTISNSNGSVGTPKDSIVSYQGQRLSLSELISEIARLHAPDHRSYDIDQRRMIIVGNVSGEMLATEGDWSCTSLAITAVNGMPVTQGDYLSLKGAIPLESYHYGDTIELVPECDVFTVSITTYDRDIDADDEAPSKITHVISDQPMTLFDIADHAIANKLNESANFTKQITSRDPIRVFDDQGVAKDRYCAIEVTQHNCRALDTGAFSVVAAAVMELVLPKKAFGPRL